MKLTIHNSRAVFVVISFLAGVLLTHYISPLLRKPQTLQAPQTAANDLDLAFDFYVDAQRKTLELFKAEDYFGESDRAQAEAYRSVLYATLGSIRTGALLDPGRPRFMRAADWTSKSGLDNPDNNYYFARILDNKNYLIRGSRGSTTQLIFQVVIGQPGVAGAGPGTNVSILNSDDLKIMPDGSFEILVGPDKPEEGTNWLRTADGAGTIMARATHADWLEERAGFLDIQEIPLEPTPPLSSVDMATSLRDAAVHLYDRNALWLSYADKTWNYRPRNDFSKMSQTKGGMPGQYSAFGSWELTEDEALLISVPQSEAAYQGIQLGNRWFISLDYETHTSSLTTKQAYLSEDGNYHFVVALKDPGIQNWLDPVGHEQGLIMLRWQGLESQPENLKQPSAQLIKLDALVDHLPQNTPLFNAEQRLQQIQTRKHAIRERFPG